MLSLLINGFNFKTIGCYFMLSLRLFLQKHVSPLLLLLYFLLLLPQAFYPLNHGHEWRQADTWAIAKNFAFEDFNFLYPRVDVREDTSGIDAAEMPWYQYFVSLLMRAFNTLSTFWGKIISMLAGLGIVYILGKWIAEELLLPRYVGYLAVAAVHILFTFAQKLMPEIFSLFFVIFGSYLLFKDFDNKNWKYLWGGTLALTIGITTRPMQIFWGLVFIYLALLSFVQEKNKSKKEHGFQNLFRYTAAGFLALLPFLFWYFYWSKHLRSFGLHYFHSIEQIYGLKNFLYGSLYTRGSNIFLSDIVGIACLPVVLYGIFIWKKQFSRSLLHSRLLLFLGLVALFTLIGMIFLTGDHILNHNYYVISMFPVFTVFSALGFYKFFQEHRKTALWYAAIIFVIPFINQSYTYRRSTDYQALLPIKKQMRLIQDSASSPVKTVIEDNGSYAWML